MGTADPLSEELYTGPSRQAWQGRLLAVCKSVGEVGEIALVARAEGLAEARVTVGVR